MSHLLADIALPVPIDHTFTYIVPPDLESPALIGARVVVPFGRKHLTGVIVALPSSTTVKGLKPIRDVLDAKPAFSEELLRLTKWIAEYYFAPWGEVLRVSIPQGLALESKQIVRLSADASTILDHIQKGAKKQRQVIQALHERGATSVRDIQKKTQIKSIHAFLNDLQARGWIEIQEETIRSKAKPKLERVMRLTERGRALIKSQSEDETSGNPRLLKQQGVLIEELALLQPDQELIGIQATIKKIGGSLSSVISLEKKGIIEITSREVLRSSAVGESEPLKPITLDEYQQRALEKIEKALLADVYKTFLLHGVTGSGKTQVYIEALRKTLERGKTAIILVPEISLTPQTVRRFKAHFGADVTVMHSQMSAGERYDAWRLCHGGRVKIAIGPRSAVFAPLENLGLIVVDEEHEASYKQFDAVPRYHARDVAIMRASHKRAVVVLGSATPSAESYHNALNGKFEMIELPQRVDGARMPEIDIIDMAQERKRRFEELKEEVKASGKPFPKRLPPLSVSRLLHDQITERIKKLEGTILLQNRRGFSHVLECLECGHVEKCDNCDVTLTYHLTKKHLRCHYCGFVKTPPSICPNCQGIEIRFHSYGTQQVQEEVHELFPTATVLRMDRDTTSRKGAHDKLLKQFEQGEADVLLGTQMVAKGLDFPRVTLVGVISADTQMLLPDFRASERTFQLLTQVAGRSGRSKIEGEVVIQTLQPDHYSLKYVKTHDFAGFYKEELEYRRELDYPPFSRIVLVEFVGERENDVQHHAKKIAEYLSQLNKTSSYIVLGPADAAIPKIKNLFRKHIVVKDLKDKDPGGTHLRSVLSKTKAQYETSPLGKSKRVRMTIDVDPVGMM